MTKWGIYIALAFFWFVVAKDFMSENPVRSEKARPVLFYILPPATILLWWFFSRFKQVMLDGDTLIIRSYQKETRVPVSQIEKVRKCNGKISYVSIVFKPQTEAGRCVRIATTDLDKVEKVLKAAMEGKDFRVKINRVQYESEKSIPHEKEIIVRGWTDEELKNILTDFADMYDDKLEKQFDLEVCPYKQGATRITFPHDISANEFSFLVNYLNYPKNYDLKARSISVTGNVTLSTAFHPAHKDFVGKKAIFYVPANDEEYDLVYAHVGNETFQIPFTNMHWKKVEDPRIPAGIQLEEPAVN